MEEISLIDVSLEDDLLISSSSDRHPDLRDPVDLHEGDNQVKTTKQSEHIPEMSESPKKKRPGKVNLRKSLAWDSAFFTSEGVLATEELAIVNSTFRKTEVCAFPGIQEELRQSTESTSTLDSESYTLENLEGDLFANLRDSIRKSVGRQENCTSGEPNESCLGPKKKGELLSQAKVAKGTGDSKLLLKPPRNLQKSTSLPITSISKDFSGNGAKRQGITAFSNTNGASSNITSRSKSNIMASNISRPPTCAKSTFKFSSKTSPRSSIDGSVIAKTSLGICTISEPSNGNTRSSTNSNTGGAKSFTPSGLRMPSPKIGYFDAERSLVCNSNKFGANRPNSSKTPSTRAAGQQESMNFDSTQTQSTPFSSLKDGSHATNDGMHAVKRKKMGN